MADPELVPTIEVPDTLEDLACSTTRTSVRFTWVCCRDPHPSAPEEHRFIRASR